MAMIHYCMSYHCKIWCQKQSYDFIFEEVTAPDARHNLWPKTSFHTHIISSLMCIEIVIRK